jgi:hypothetical protein
MKVDRNIANKKPRKFQLPWPKPCSNGRANMIDKQAQFHSWSEYNRRTKEEIDGLPLYQQEVAKKALAQELGL